MKIPEKLDVKLQAEVLQVGQTLSSQARAATRTPGQCQLRPDEMGADIDRVLTLVRAAKVAPPQAADVLGYLHEKREGGAHRVKIHGFHALRSTFVTLP